VVAIDKRRGPHGKPIEILGSYDPGKEKAKAQIKVERVEYWLKNGAKPTETVASLIKASK
jgi:small subunit ribosomal protein S16